MSATLIRCGSLLSIMLGLSTPALAIVEPASTDQVRLLVDKITQAQSRISSITFKCAEDYETHLIGGLSTFHDDWDVAQRDAYRSAARDTTAIAAQGVQHFVSRAVLNDQYFVRAYNNSTGYQSLHASIKTTSEKIKTEVAQYDQLDLLKFGFGDTHYYFSEWAFVTMPSLRWHVEIAGPIHKLIGVDAVTGGLSRVWSIDSSKDFFIVAVTDYHNGKVASQLTVDPLKTADNIWLPATAQQLTYPIGLSPTDLAALGLKTEDSIQRQTKWVFSDQQLNPNIPDDVFTTAFLKLPNAAPVQQRQLDGTEHVMIYVNGSVMSQKAGFAAMRASQKVHP